MRISFRPDRICLLTAGLLAFSAPGPSGSAFLTAQEVQTNGNPAPPAAEPLPPPNIEPPLDDPEAMMLEEPVGEETLEPNATPPSDEVDMVTPEPLPPVEEPPLPEQPENILDAGRETRTGWKKNFFPHFRIGGYYDDNIFIQNRDRQGDYIGFVGFGLRAGLGNVQAPLYTLREGRNVPTLYEAPPQPYGNFLLADYSGTLFGFANHSSESSYDQDALLSLGWSGSKLSLGLEGRFQSLSGANIDIGNRVRRNIFYGGLNSRYELSEKSSLEGNFAYISTQYQGLVDSGEWTGELWYNYQLTPKLKIAPGLGGGVLKIDGSPSQPYGRALVRATYDYSEKVSFTGRLGAEYRDVDHGSGWRNNPIFAFGVTWRPQDGTELGLNAYRLVEASALRAGEDYTRTGVAVTLRQRFLQRFHLSLTGGYENLDYRNVDDNDSPSRGDDYFFGRAMVAFDVTRWCNANVFYNFQRDSSSLADQSFTDNQVGLELNFAF